MSSNPSEGRTLRIGEVARRYGVGPDTIRAWVRQGSLHATKSESGQRLFSEREVEADLTARGKGAPAVPAAPARPPSSPPVRQAQGPVGRLMSVLGPANFGTPEVIIAREELELARLEGEKECLRRSIHDENAASDSRKAAEDAKRQARERLERLKSYGHQQASTMPIEWWQIAVADLERYVNETNLPATLSEADSQALVAARVQRVRSWLRQSIEEKAKEEADQLRVESLLARARRSATLKTLAWDSPESDDFRDELLDDLREELDETWDEARVDRFLDRFYEEWLDDLEADEQADDDEESW